MSIFQQQLSTILLSGILPMFQILNRSIAFTLYIQIISPIDIAGFR